MAPAIVVAVALALQASAPVASLVRTTVSPDSEGVVIAAFGSNVKRETPPDSHNAGQPPLLKKIHNVRAELCSHRFTNVSDGLDKCMKFMIGRCNPGDDMVMNGEPGERLEGEPGDCARFFKGHPQPVVKEERTSELVWEELEEELYNPDDMILASCDFEVLDELIFVFEEKDVDSIITGQLEKGDIVAGHDDGVWVTLEDKGGHCLKEKDGRPQLERFVAPSVVHHRPHSPASSDEGNDFVRDSNPPDMSDGHEHMDRARYGEGAEAKEVRELPAPNLPRVGAWDLPEATTTTPAPPKAAAQPRVRALTAALATIIAAASVSLC